MSLLLTLNMFYTCLSVSLVDFERLFVCKIEAPEMVEKVFVTVIITFQLFLSFFLLFHSLALP